MHPHSSLALGRLQRAALSPVQERLLWRVSLADSLKELSLILWLRECGVREEADLSRGNRGLLWVGHGFVKVSFGFCIVLSRG